ncbi:MAG TPA: sulfite exporter TauE/SafE family protein [Terrimicrobiaceae bacterium]
MYDLTPVEWTLSALAALAIGMAKAGFGGLGMLAILAMARVLPPRESTGAILPMLILADVFAVHTYRKHANGRLVLRILPPALAGIVCGWLLMPHIPAQEFGKLIGWLTVALVVLVLFQKFASQLTNLAVEHPGIAWPFGWLAGSTTMLANAAGPVMTIYLLACRLPKFEFVGTAAWFFFAVNLFKVPFSASLGLINGASLTLNLSLAPAVIAGVFAGRWLLGKINQAVFEWLMIVFSLLGGLRLILS